MAKGILAVVSSRLPKPECNSVTAKDFTVPQLLILNRAPQVLTTSTTRKCIKFNSFNPLPSGSSPGGDKSTAVPPLSSTYWQLSIKAPLQYSLGT